MDIYAAAENILENIEGVFAEAGVDLPAVRFIAIGAQGDVAYDCLQLSVSWDQTYSGIPGDQSQTPVKCVAIHSGVFVVELVRCVPVPKTLGSKLVAVSVPARNASAKSLMEDADLLFQAGMQACENTAFGSGLVDISSTTPSGGYQGIVMNVTMSV